MRIGIEGQCTRNLWLCQPVVHFLQSPFWLRREGGRLGEGVWCCLRRRVVMLRDIFVSTRLNGRCDGVDTREMARMLGWGCTYRNCLSCP
jgi:hypothetical protein